MEWSLETYRLDEIERKFDLPCVICLTEGFYSETDTEGFSQGDIMSIDSKLILHKVAANFAFNKIGRHQQDPNYVELVENEILVPLNYKGKLKVLRDVKNFNSVRELAAEFPRYAKVRENMEVTTERNVQVTIQAGTVIELDRIIPGHNTEHGEQPAKLVIQFQHRTGFVVVAIPLSGRGKFRTEPDDNEYTIKEAIHSKDTQVQMSEETARKTEMYFLKEKRWMKVTIYQLPQFIRFVDDEIKRVYTQDLLEGIENMRTITSETLRLNRLVTQNVLVGHYKPVDEIQTNDSERFRQRTLAVLPLDNPEIREIEVHVLKGITEDIYEEVFLVRNVSRSSSAEIIEGSLYIDFAMTPGIKIISHKDTEQKNEDSPPPRPPKPRNLKMQQKGTKADKGRVVPKTKPPEVKPFTQADLDDYEIPEPSPSFSSEPMTTCLADLNLNAPGGWKLPMENKASGLFSNLKNKIRANVSVTAEAESAKAMKKESAAVKHNRLRLTPVDLERKHVTAMVAPTKPDVKVILGEEDYDQVDEWKMMGSPRTCQRPPQPLPASSGTKDNSNTYLKSSGVKQKPTAHVFPSNGHVEDRTKLFKDLNNVELVKRLKLCGLDEFARFCEKENLDGAFFTNISKEILSNEMNLSGISLFKFVQMRDCNWIPT